MSKGEDLKALETLMKVEKTINIEQRSKITFQVAKENGKQLPPGDLVASEAEKVLYSYSYLS